MDENRKKLPRLQYLRMQIVIVVFLLLAFVLVMFQRNVTYDPQTRKIDFLPSREAVAVSGSAVQDDGDVLREQTECLLLWEEEENSLLAREMAEPILEQMRISYRLATTDDFEKEDLESCRSVMLAVANLDILGEKVLDLIDWVKAGGDVMFLFLPSGSGVFEMIQNDLGIVAAGDEMAIVEKLRFPRPFMIGGEGETYMITDPFDSSLSVSLGKDCDVYMESEDEHPVPIVWRRDVGEGTIVVCNLGIFGKAYRGIYSMAYSLLGDLCAWPVINASVFYIDDFPAPVPEGDSEYIKKEFGLNISDFYTRIWWNDVYNLAKKYGIRYTGLVIEEYSDEVRPPFERNENVQQYEYFGNMLLDQGGEIGLHGYNHMPLVLPNFDYMGQFDSYVQFGSYGDMRASIQELMDFCRTLFPQEKIQVYVPPSNILSEEGKNMLLTEFPEIKVIASIYLPGDLAYEQEFEEQDGGVVETPRVISGYILNDYNRLTALSELNFHFINSHFQHPDDILDEDRGASLGWTEMYSRLTNYVDWLYKAAPDIRNLTGSELAAAVQRYDRLNVTKTVSGNSLRLKLGGFEDEAWMFVRLNGGKTVKSVEGGTAEQLLDGLYLLKAQQSQVDIITE